MTLDQMQQEMDDIIAKRHSAARLPATFERAYVEDLKARIVAEESGATQPERPMPQTELMRTLPDGPDPSGAYLGHEPL